MSFYDNISSFQNQILLKEFHIFEKTVFYLFKNVLIVPYITFSNHIDTKKFIKIYYEKRIPKIQKFQLFIKS